MDFTLNELSLTKLDSKEKTIAVFLELSQVVSVLSSIGFKAMKIWNRSNFMTYDFHNGFTLVDWLKDNKHYTDVEKNRILLLKSLITKKDSL